MPGQYLTEDEMWSICGQAAMTVAKEYGITQIGPFTEALMAVAFAECGTMQGEQRAWDSQAVHDQGQGFGLFGLHNQGYAGNFSEEQRLDPLQNALAAARKLGPIWADGEKKGQSPAEILGRMTGPEGQNPADPQALFRNAQAAAQWIGQVAGRVAGMAGQAGLGGFAPAGGQATAGEGRNLTPGQWVEQMGMMPSDYGADWENPMPGERGDYWISQQMPEYRKWIFEQYSSAMGLGEAGVPAWEREATEARTAYDWASAERVIRELGGDTYEDARQRILDQIDEKKWTADQAIKEFNAWMSGALEAGKRAETVYGEEKERKVWTTPGEYYPGTGPGGRNEQMYARYGLEHTPSPGVPVSQMPNLDEMYGQWHGRMGISEQAPPTAGGWSGQGMGQGAPGGQGTGAAAAQAFLEQLMQQHAPQFGAGRA